MSHYHYWLLSRISGHSRENSGQRWISNPETNGLVLKWLWYESQAERIILSTVVNTQDDYNVSESASQLTSEYWHVAPLIAAHCAKPPDAGRAEEWGDLQRPPCLLRLLDEHQPARGQCSSRPVLLNSVHLVRRGSAQAGTETSSGGCLSATSGDPTSSTSGGKQTVVNIFGNFLKYVYSGFLMGDRQCERECGRGRGGGRGRGRGGPRGGGRGTFGG